jgi:hypothetical protein
MDLNHEDPKSEWRVEWHCPICEIRGWLIVSGVHIRCNTPGEFRTVSPLICCICGKNAVEDYEYTFCTYTGKSNPHYDAMMQDLVEQGVVMRVPPIERASSEEELLDFEKAMSKRWT